MMMNPMIVYVVTSNKPDLVRDREEENYPLGVYPQTPDVWVFSTRESAEAFAENLLSKGKKVVSVSERTVA